MHVKSTLEQGIYVFTRGYVILEVMYLMACLTSGHVLQEYM